MVLVALASPRLTDGHRLCGCDNQRSPPSWIQLGVPGRPQFSALDDHLRYDCCQSQPTLDGPALHTYPHQQRGTANFLVNRRMNKSQQMRWSRRGADLLLQVRCAICNGTLGSGFGHRFQPHANQNERLANAACPPIRWTLPPTRLEVAIERREPKAECLHEDRDVIKPDRQPPSRSQPDVGFREVVPYEQ
jgi:hypothetical protein